MKETVWIYPGSFDPVTYGHMDIIRRAAALCGTLVIGVVEGNVQKKSTLFSTDERVNMIRSVTGDISNVRIATFSGLQADFYREFHADAVVRGIRSGSDVENELIMDGTQRMLLPGFETIVMMSAPELTFVSSSTVRILASYGGDISAFVPESVERAVRERFREKYGQQD